MTQHRGPEIPKADADRLAPILGRCICIDAYKLRGLVDPTCACCEHGAEVLELLDRIAVLEEEKRQTAFFETDPESWPQERAIKYCPFKDPLHFHHDGCPSEWAADEQAGRNK